MRRFYKSKGKKKSRKEFFRLYTNRLASLLLEFVPFTLGKKTLPTYLAYGEVLLARFLNAKEK